jgi:predicted aspartyl protease
MSRSLSWLLACVIAFIPGTSLATDACQVTRLSSRVSSTHIEIMSNKPWVYVSMNGSRPMHFILDAGSPFTVLNTGLPQQVGFTVVGDTTFAGGFKAKRYTPRACVRALGATMSNIEIGDIGLDQVSQVEGTRLEGLIGGQFFLRHVVRINYMESSIDLFPKTYDYQGDGSIIPLRVDGLMFADALIEAPDGRQVKGNFIVDTGVRMPLLVNGSWADANGLLTAEKRVPGATVGVGVNGETRGDIFRVRSATLGNFTLHDVMTVAARDSVVISPAGGLAGIIGGDFLRRFRMTIDYPHQRLVLEQTPETYSPFVYDRSGTFLLGEGDDYRTIRVHDVFANSPAADAGVHAGDRIVSVNGTNARRLGLEKVRALFREDHTRYRLVLERGGELVNAQLITKELLETRAAVVEGAAKGS